MMICPKDCPDRSPTCHGSCQRYKEGRKKLDEIKAQKLKDMEVKDALFHVHASSLMKHSPARSKKK